MLSRRRKQSHNQVKQITEEFLDKIKKMANLMHNLEIEGILIEINMVKVINKMKEALIPKIGKDLNLVIVEEEEDLVIEDHTETEGHMETEKVDLEIEMASEAEVEEEVVDLVIEEALVVEVVSAAEVDLVEEDLTETEKADLEIEMGSEVEVEEEVDLVGEEEDSMIEAILEIDKDLLETEKEDSIIEDSKIEVGETLEEETLIEMDLRVSSPQINLKKIFRTTY